MPASIAERREKAVDLLTDIAMFCLGTIYAEPQLIEA